jgi:hypothetical protein
MARVGECFKGNRNDIGAIYIKVQMKLILLEI